MLFDLHFSYFDDNIVRPYVVNCNLDKVGHYTQKVSHLACVAEIFIRIHPSHPSCHFYEFTI